MGSYVFRAYEPIALRKDGRRQPMENSLREWAAPIS